MAKLYDDLIKFAKDFRLPNPEFLNKAFNYDRKVELKTKASNGVSWTSDASLLAAGGAGANLQFAYKSGNFAVEKLKVGTSKQIEGEFSLKQGLPSTDLTFKFTDGTHTAKAESTANLIGTWSSGVWSGADLTTVIDATVVPSLKIDAKALVNHEGILVGAAGKVDTGLLRVTPADATKPDEKAAGGFNIEDYGLLVGYKAADFTAAIATSKKLSVLKLGLTHQAASDITAGALVSMPTPGYNTTSKDYFLSVGLQYKLDADTTITGAVDHDMKIQGNYKQALNKFATISASASVDARDVGGDDHKFGLTFTLSN